MKKNLWINLLGGILFSLAAVSNMFGGDLATVNVGETDMTRKEDSSDLIATLCIGTKVSIEREGDKKYYVTYGRDKGWIAKSDLVVYDDQFSDVNPGGLLCDTIFRDGDADFLVYYFGDYLNKINVNNWNERVSNKIGMINEIHSSGDDDLYLLEGTMTNLGQIHQFKIYRMDEDDILEIGSFDFEDGYLNSALFSENLNYLSLNLNVDGDDYVIVYSTDDGSVVGWAEDAKNCQWYKNSLIINDNSHFWYANFDADFTNLNIGYQAENNLLDIDDDWIVSKFVDSKIVDGFLYIATDGKTQAFDLNSLKLETSSFRGLYFNESGTLNYYFDDKDLPRMKNVSTGNLYGYFGGEEPKYEFVQFVGGNPVYRAKSENIYSLYIFYTESGMTDYQYKAVDDVDAVGEDFIIAESVTEDDLFLISVEMPLDEKFRILLLTEGS